MKNMKFLLGLFCLVLLFASCASMQDATAEDRDENNIRRYGNRVYVDDPYYGTVVLERDPFTGRYYDVTFGYGGWASPYNSWPLYRGVGGVPPVYRNGGGRVLRPAQPAPRVDREAARKKILGN